MSIIEQVKELREIAKEFDLDDKEELAIMLNKAADAIESLYAKLQAANMEWSADCGGWIPCSERLPEEKINPITQDFYEYQVTFKNEDVTDIRNYKFGKGHWWNGPWIMDKHVIAWRQNIEPYHEEKTEAGI